MKKKRMLDLSHHARNHLSILGCKVPNRSEDFIKYIWNCDLLDYKMDSRPNDPSQALSQESKDIIIASLGRKEKDCQRISEVNLTDSWKEKKKV